MDLRTFVAESLRQIIGGIGDAQRGLDELGTNARINPALVNESSRKQHAPPSPVEFDIALTVADSHSEAHAEGSSERTGLISVVSAEHVAGRNSDTSTTSRSEAVSRVRFSVLIAQPSDLETYRTPVMSVRRDRNDGF